MSAAGIYPFVLLGSRVRVLTHSTGVSPDRTGQTGTVLSYEAEHGLTVVEFPDGGRNSFLADELTILRPVLTHCAICNRPLTDAASVEIGIGPDCRKRADFETVPEATRVQANEVIYQISAHRDDHSFVLVMTDKLRELGLEKLAQAIVRRFAEIRVTVDSHGTLGVQTPFRPELPAAFHAIGGHWARTAQLPLPARAWHVCPAARQDLWTLLCRTFPGAVLVVEEAGKEEKTSWLPALASTQEERREAIDTAKATNAARMLGAPAVLPSGEVVVFRARRSGKCLACQKPTSEGETIGWRRGEGGWHLDCLPPETQRVRAQRQARVPEYGYIRNTARGWRS